MLNRKLFDSLLSQYSTHLVWLFGALVYFSLAKKFVNQALLNLTPGRIQDLNIPFNITPEAVDLGTTIVTLAITVVIFTGVYNLSAGHLTPRQYDTRIQGITLLAALPIILYFYLHIKWLKENDSSWYFDLEFMGEMAGFTLSNDWPFDTILQDSRWQFYRVGLYNAIRVVLLSIFGCTILGVFIGVSRLSRNKLLSGLATAYVDFFRNMPLVVQLFFLYTVVLGERLLKPFSEIRDHTFFEWVYWSNRGIVFPEYGIEDMKMFILAIAIFLLTRIYIRFSERIEIDEDAIESSSSLSAYLRRPFAGVGKKSEPIVADIVLSFSVLILLYGLFNIVEWKYTMKPGETEGSLVALISSFFNSFVQGIITFEPFSMFVIGTIALVVSALSVFNLNEAGLNNFTVDDSSQGMRQRLILWAVVILIMVVLFSSSISFEKPHLITEKQVMVDDVLVTQELSWGLWKFEEGTSQTVGSVFIALWIGLTLYTAAQIAEIVRGSIQALPRGQIEAAISLGLSPYQRLKLVILPQALRSMIPSMTNQYLNCWKNSSLAFVVGFSDFYAVFTTIVNNAGQAVPVFIMILFTYQAGSLVISAIMNYINSSVTKVKI